MLGCAFCRAPLPCSCSRHRLDRRSTGPLPSACKGDKLARGVQTGASLFYTWPVGVSMATTSSEARLHACSYQVAVVSTQVASSEARLQLSACSMSVVSPCHV